MKKEIAKEGVSRVDKGFTKEDSVINGPRRKRGLYDGLRIGAAETK